MGAALPCQPAHPALELPTWDARHPGRCLTATRCPAKKIEARCDYYALQPDSTTIFQDSIQSMAQLHDKILIFAHVRCASTDTAGTTGNWECRGKLRPTWGWTLRHRECRSPVASPCPQLRPGFGFSPAALRWCLETCQRVSMGEQPRSARTGDCR